MNRTIFAMFSRTGRGRDLLGPVIGLVLVLAIFGAFEPERFLSLQNFRTVTNQSVIVALGAIGMTLIMISGGIDLAVGSVIAFGTVAAAFALRSGYPPIAALAACILAGGVAGLINGALVTGLRIMPFIATLGTLEIFRGAAQIAAGEQKIDAPATWLNRIMAAPDHGSWQLFSPGVWFTLAAVAGMTWFLHYTLLGRHIFAIGSNEEAARLCGIPVPRRKIQIYAIGGLFAGMAALAQFARLGVGDPTVAVGKELDIIAAVVIGGGSLAGGRGSIPGAVIGALIMSFLRNGCTLVGISSPMQKVVVGAIIITAVALDRWRRR